MATRGLHPRRRRRLVPAPPQGRRGRVLPQRRRPGAAQGRGRRHAPGHLLSSPPTASCSPTRTPARTPTSCATCSSQGLTRVADACPSRAAQPGAVKVGDLGQGRSALHPHAAGGRPDRQRLHAHPRPRRQGRVVQGHLQRHAGGDQAARDHLWLTAAEWKALVPASRRPGDKLPLPARHRRAPAALPPGRQHPRRAADVAARAGPLPADLTLTVDGGRRPSGAAAAGGLGAAGDRRRPGRRRERGFDVRLLGHLALRRARKTCSTASTSWRSASTGATGQFTPGARRPGRSRWASSSSCAPAWCATWRRPRRCAISRITWRPASEPLLWKGSRTDFQSCPLLFAQEEDGLKIRPTETPGPTLAVSLPPEYTAVIRSYTAGGTLMLDLSCWPTLPRTGSTPTSSIRSRPDGRTSSAKTPSSPTVSTSSPCWRWCWSASSCGAVGSLVVGGRMAFFSDALAHCAFAGVSSAS